MFISDLNFQQTSDKISDPSLRVKLKKLFFHREDWVQPYCGSREASSGTMCCFLIYQKGLVEAQIQNHCMLVTCLWLNPLKILQCNCINFYCLDFFWCYNYNMYFANIVYPFILAYFWNVYPQTLHMNMSVLFWLVLLVCLVFISSSIVKET